MTTANISVRSSDTIMLERSTLVHTYNTLNASFGPSDSLSGQCFCGNQLNSLATPEPMDQCNMACNVNIRNKASLD